MFVGVATPAGVLVVYPRTPIFAFKGLDHQEGLDLFENILKVDSVHIFKLIESGEHRVELDSLWEMPKLALW